MVIGNIQRRKVVIFRLYLRALGYPEAKPQKSVADLIHDLADGVTGPELVL